MVICLMMMVRSFVANVIMMRRFFSNRKVWTDYDNNDDYDEFNDNDDDDNDDDDDDGEVDGGGELI